MNSNIKYIEVKYLSDIGLAKITVRDEKGLRSRHFTLKQAVNFMFKHGHVWEWFKDDNGNDTAVWEKEEG